MLEDDEGLRTSLRLLLEDRGFVVDEFARAETALDAVTRHPVDLMLVDLMLGGMDGFSFIQRVRPTSQAPIVVLSARDSPDDIIAALEAGADDYVTKPFDVGEVHARIKALLRRPSLADHADLAARRDSVTLDSHDQPLVFDMGAGVLKRGGDEIPLTSTEYRLLTVLTQHAGLVLSRTALLERVWDRGYFGDERIVDVHVRRLRKKLELEPSAPTTLVTVRGLGYRLDPR